MNGVSIVSVSEPLDRNPKWRHVMIRRGNPPMQERAICFSGGESLVPGPLPDGWTVKESERGPVVEAQRQARGGGGGGGYAAAFRNTKEGHYYEQDRMDRRTALMQAVQAAQVGGNSSSDTMLAYAETFYNWLRKGA